MVDPLSIVSVVEGSIGLALQCGSAAKALNNLIARFKNSELTLMAMVEEVETIKFAWTRIREWFEGQGTEVIDDEFLERLSKSLRCGTLVISALVQDLADFDNGTTTISFKKRSRMAWNEGTLMDHQQRIRGQVQAMSLMLQVLELSNPKARIELLQTNELKLRESDESACSIVPSRMSSRLSSQASLRLSDSESLSHNHVGADSRTMVYRRLSFEDNLFTARVYKRNYRNVWTSSSSHDTLHGKAKDLLHRNRRSIPTTLTESNRNPCNSSFDDVTQRVKSPEAIIKSYNDHQGFHNIHQALRRAVYSRNVDDARILLMNGGEINHFHGTSVSAWTNLHYAAYRGDTAMAEVLLLAGVDIAGQAADGMQPLHVACMNECRDHHLTEMIRLFLDTGADANCVDGIGRRPLHLASMRKDPQAIRLLVSRGADLEAEIGQIRGRTPLQTASGCFGNISSVRTLLELGANVNVESPSSYSPLEAAVFGNEVEIVEELIQHGADPNFQPAGNTETIVIRYASWIADVGVRLHDSIDVLDTIFEHGADIHAQDRAGNQVLHFLAPYTPSQLVTTSRGNMAQLIQYLIQKGADPNAQNHKQETPLLLAILKCNFLFVRQVLGTGKGYLLMTEKQRLTQCLLKMETTRAIPFMQKIMINRMIALLDEFPSTNESIGIENTRTDGSSNEMEVGASDAGQQIPGSEGADHVMVPI